MLLVLDDWLRARALTPIVSAGATDAAAGEADEADAVMDKVARKQAKRGRKERGVEGVAIPPLGQVSQARIYAASASH